MNYDIVGSLATTLKIQIYDMKKVECLKRSTSFLSKHGGVVVSMFDFTIILFYKIINKLI